MQSATRLGGLAIGITLLALACTAPYVEQATLESEPIPRNEPPPSGDGDPIVPVPADDGTSPFPQACEDTCANEGERRCKDAKSFEACLRAANGCLAWSGSPCQGSATCDASSGANGACFGQCPPAGKTACPQLDAKRCTGAKLEACTQESGCLVWKETQDCGASGKICDGSACVTQCTSNCTTLNERRCVAGTNNYETCKEVQPGCKKWQAATSCGLKVCTGAGSCVCNDQCTTTGSNACVSPTTFKTCTTNAAGCKVYTAQKNCVRSVPSPGCFAYAKACFGTCDDQCNTEGQIICTGSSSYQRCVRGSDQCLDIQTGSCKTSQVCFANPATCANGP